MADKVDATFHGPPRKVRLFFQVFENEALQDEGEYITYEGDWQNKTELQDFLDKVALDLKVRVNLLGFGKSMLTPDLTHIEPPE